MAEYIIIAILVAIVVIVAIRRYGGSISEQVGGATESIANVKTENGRFPRVEGGGSTGPESGKENSEEFSGSAGERAAGDAERGGGSMDDLKPAGVGEQDYKPVERIQLDWKFLGFIFGLFAAAAFAVVFVKRKKGKGAKKLFQRQQAGKKKGSK